MIHSNHKSILLAPRGFILINVSHSLAYVSQGKSLQNIFQTSLEDFPFHLEYFLVPTSLCSKATQYTPSYVLLDVNIKYFISLKHIFHIKRLQLKNFTNHNLLHLLNFKAVFDILKILLIEMLSKWNMINIQIFHTPEIGLMLWP